MVVENMGSLRVLSPRKRAAWRAAALLCGIHLLCASSVRGSFSTPNTGVDWTMAELVNQSGGAVSGTAPNYALSDDIFVKSNDTLRISAGTRVTAGDGGTYPHLVIQGTLLATGTETDPIVLTSGALRGGDGDYDRCLEFQESASSNSVIDWVTMEHSDYGCSLIRVNGIRLSHCTMRNCNRGARVSGAAHFEHCTFASNGSEDRPLSGAGLYDYGGNVFVTNCVFRENTAHGTSDGGGVYCRGNTVLVDCHMTGNRADYGGGVYCYQGGELAQCNLHDNSSSNRGGGIYLRMGGTARGCEVAGNEAENGGGIYCSEGGTVSNCLLHANRALWGAGAELLRGGLVVDCVATGNVAEKSGGGVYLNEGGDLRGGTLAGNSAERGGGLYADVGGLLQDVAFVGNHATYGGGVYVDTTGRLAACTFTSNEAEASGGAAYCNQGGTLDACSMESNTASYGGGAYLDSAGRVRNGTFNANVASNYGGGIYCTDGGLVSNCVVAVNQADWGGGLYLLREGLVIDCTVTGNVCASSGGGVYLSDGGMVVNGSISGNRGSSGAGIICHGGGLVSNATLAVNVAGSRGGGAYCYQGGTVALCRLHGNTATEGGGVYCSEGGEIRQCEVSSNAAPYGAGVYCYVSGLVSDCTFVANTAATNGGGAFCNAGGTLTGCRLVHNVAAYGAGVYCQSGGLVADCLLATNVAAICGGGGYCYRGGTFRLCEISSNTATNGGGGIYIKLGGEASSCEVRDNEAEDGGGLYCLEGGTVSNCVVAANRAEFGAGVNFIRGGEAIDCTITRNVCLVSGGGAYLQDGALVSGGTFADNEATYGGGVMCDSGGVIRSACFVGNRAERGGAVNCYFGGSVSQCTVHANQAAVSGGGIRCRSGGEIVDTTITGNRSQWGGGMYCLDGGSVSGSTLASNAAHWAAGIYCSRGGRLRNCDISWNTEAEYGGGAIIRESGEFYDCRFVGNASTNKGGGLMILWGGLLSSCSVSNNASDKGGGLYCYDGGTVRGSAVTGNHAKDGGGAYCLAGGFLETCVITDNTADHNGGGLKFDGGGEARSCLVARNTARSTGGIYCDWGTVRNCTVSGNRAKGRSGGVYCYDRSTVENSILYGNEAPLDPNWQTVGVFVDYRNCAAVPAPPGTGHVTNSPGFLCVEDGDFRLSWDSHCVDAGTNAPWMAVADDLAGTPRVAATTVDIGAYENSAYAADFGATPRTGLTPLTVALTAAASGTNAAISCFHWDLDGNGDWDVVGWGLTSITSVYADAGGHTVRLLASNAVGEVDDVLKPDYVTVYPRTQFVAQAGAHVAPFADWATAATSVQAAVSAAIDGVTILVSNGFYALPCELVVDRGVHLYGVSGPYATILEGSGTNRCIALQHPDAVVEGFTVRGGRAEEGGGAYLDGYGTLRRCFFTDNAAKNGGAVYCRSGGRIEDCFVAGNRAWEEGGGIYSSQSGTVVNCTIVDNVAEQGGGTSFGSVFSSIVYHNHALGAERDANYDGGRFTSSCTHPHHGSGDGNTAEPPLLVGLRNPHLLTGSPCIDTGDNASALTTRDWDGLSRISGGVVDMGCDEFSPSSATNDLAVRIVDAVSRAIPGYPVTFEGHVEGQALGTRWTWEDGTVSSNVWREEHIYTETGHFAVVFSAWNGQVVAADTVSVEVVTDMVRTYASSSGSNVWPYGTWQTAARRIQDAIDAAPPRSTVLVAPGTYEEGTFEWQGTRSRIGIDKPLNVLAADPDRSATTIKGQGPPGENAVRCAYVGAGAVLAGFTLTGGHTLTTGDDVFHQCGGGAWCDENGTVSNCLVTGNAAGEFGGGIYSGLVRGCLVASNTAAGGGGVALSVAESCVIVSNKASSLGGGAIESALTRCRLSDNTAKSGGGASFGELADCFVFANTATYSGGGTFYSFADNCTIVCNSALRMEGGGVCVADGGNGECRNCIIYHNTSGRGLVSETDNYRGNAFEYCCTTPLPEGVGNFTNRPDLASLSEPSLLSESACIDAGNSSLVGSPVDIEGEPRINGPAVDVGCDEFWGGSLTGTLAVAITAPFSQAVIGYPLTFRSRIAGSVSGLHWSWGDGLLATNDPTPVHTFRLPGQYTVTLTAWNATHVGTATATVDIVAGHTNYVSLVGAHVPPFATWGTAATNIQSAVDAAPEMPGTTVLVAPGIYRTGEYIRQGMKHRVGLYKPLVLQALDTDVGATVIEGRGPTGPSAMRGVYVGADAFLTGFTVTNGHTSGVDEGKWPELGGGGAWCEPGGTISNCFVRSNRATYGSGGGIWGGHIVDSIISSNTAYKGGGAAYAALERCRVLTNVAGNDGGGGLSESVAWNSLIAGNRTDWRGGGAVDCTLENCTVVGNASHQVAGLYTCAARNTVIFYNSDASVSTEYSGGTYVHCCTVPLPEGRGNFTSAPVLTSLLNPHLLATSPCIDAGTNWAALALTDIDAEARVIGGVVDVGCDEFDLAALTGRLSVAFTSYYTNAVREFALPFQATVEGRATGTRWTWEPGGRRDNTFTNSVAFGSPGQHALVFAASNLEHTAVVTTWVHVVEAYTNYVSPSGAHVHPFAEWQTAATNIQDAVDIAVPGGTVFVGPGVYDHGEFEKYGMRNRVGIHRPVRVVAADTAPGQTVIVGKGPPSSSAVRCVYIVDRAELIGFTLSNGFTEVTGKAYEECSGGGAWCAPGAVLSNCLVVANRAEKNGGGVYGGQVMASVLRANRAQKGGGACQASLVNCFVVSNSAAINGGGTFDGTVRTSTLYGNWALHYGGGCAQGLVTECHIAGNAADHGGGVTGSGHRDAVRNCHITANTCSDSGGGAYRATLQGCLITGNAAPGLGGGAHDSTVDACTVCGNSALRGGGTDGCDVQSSIVYFNTAIEFADNASSYCYYTNSCSFPLKGSGGTEADPLFLGREGGDYRLRASSPCIDGGVNSEWMMGAVDLLGNRRILNHEVDMGAYETPFYLRARVFLQGPYGVDGSNTMNSVLHSDGLVPSASPYASARTTLPVPSNITDWVLLDLRDTNGISVVASSCFLRRDGAIVAADGGRDVLTEVSPGAALHVVVKHRNHLAAMSPEPVAYTNTIVTYDFTTGPGKYVGGTNACAELEPGVWGLIPGDCNGDGSITWVDRAIVSNSLGKVGYLQADVNLDGVVTKEEVP